MAPPRLEARPASAAGRHSRRPLQINVEDTPTKGKLPLFAPGQSVDMQASASAPLLDLQGGVLAKTLRPDRIRAGSAGHGPRQRDGRRIRSAASAPEIGNSTLDPRRRPSSAGAIARQSKPKRPATAGTFIRSLAPITQTQNGKAEVIEARMVQFLEAQANEGMADRRSPAMAREDSTALSLKFEVAREFEETIKEFEGTLNQMGRRIRMEAFTDGKTRRRMEEDAKRAEEKRKKDEAARKLRQAAKETQNPKRRVELRLEQTRQATDPDIVTSSKVPMKKLNAGGGGYGDYAIPVVDVRLLQSNAIGLNVGSKTFSSIYGIACDHEKRVAWERHALGPKESRPDHIKLNKQHLMSRTSEVMNDKIREQQLRYEGREKQAQQRRHQFFEEKSFQQLAAMRSGIGLDTPVCSPGAAKALKGISAAAHEAVDMGTVPEVQSRLRRRLSAQFSVGSPTAKSALGESGNFSSEGGDAGVATRPFWWGVVRGVVAMIWLLNLVRVQHAERTAAAHTMVHFLENLGRVRMIKDGARRLRKAIIRVQGACRVFLLRKRQWVSGNTGLWISIEDKYCQQNFHRVFAGTFDFGSSRNRGDDIFGSPTKHAAMSPDANLRWQSFRIPPSQRKFALGQWYTRQLKKKMAAQREWLQTIEMGVTQKRDLLHFYNLCGFDAPENEAAGRRIQTETEEVVIASDSGANFLTLDEQEILELIAVAAHELRDKNIRPFHKHWDCKGGSKARGSLPSKSRIGVKRASLMSQSPNEEPTPEAQVTSEDLEELFRMFTPRLRQIRDAPAAVEDRADLVMHALPVS